MDKVKMQGILEKGYGIIPKMLMLDKEIDIEAKAIYGYLASYAGNGVSAFPGVDKIVSDLSITRRRFYKYRNQLVDKGYISVEIRRNGSRRINNLYTLNTIISVPLKCQNETVQNATVHFETVQNETVQNSTTNNNSINNNNFNSNRENSSSSSIETTATAIIYYKENVNRNLYPKEKKILTKYIESLGNELVIRGIDEAVDKNAVNLGYVSAVLERYEKQKKTIEDLDVEKANRGAANKNKENSNGKIVQNSFNSYKGQRKYDMNKVRKELLGMDNKENPIF